MPSLNLAEEITAVGTTIALASLPIFGPLMAGLVSGPLAIASRQDQDRWLRKVAQAVDWLVEQQLLTRDLILADQEFRAAVTRGSRLALETSREEKHETLANAACNSGSWIGNDKVLTARFFRLLENYEPEHLKLLDAVSTPSKIIDEIGSHAPDIQILYLLKDVILKESSEADVLGLKMLEELRRDGLIFRDLEAGSLLRRGESSATSMGTKFLDFCSKPQMPNSPKS